MQCIFRWYIKTKSRFTSMCKSHHHNIRSITNVDSLISKRLYVNINISL
ncbi:hypothetical protein FWK35_00004877 [Aphis craccivora]|uniref:Uncharacterized protein n=1 Tax=Aphis craccivora TaxID=307492 RepID=A0A6G0YUG9_APHCR|nr:hypothetical protein FWK35_00004877 [Aphis craccivora]